MSDSLSTINHQRLTKLFLVGLPGSGKSFLGKKLAAALNILFIDLDQVIEHESSIAIAQLFSAKGESYFRAIEAKALREQSRHANFVMSCGGGTPCFHDNMKFINETGISLFVDTPVVEILGRMDQQETGNRPLFTAHDGQSVNDTLHTLMQKRRPVYEQAHLTISNSDVAVAEILALCATFIKP